jgi:hypothetical protein
MLNNAEQATKLEASLRNMRFLWAKFLIAVVMFSLFTFVLSPAREPYEPETGQMLFMVFLGLSICSVAASFFVKTSFSKRAESERKVDLFHTGLVISLVLCEAAAIIGVVSHFSINHPFSFVMFVLAGLGELLHFPRREQLFNVAFGRGA